MVLAERVGFEPTWGCPPSDFESETPPFWISHLSIIYQYKQSIIDISVP